MNEKWSQNFDRSETRNLHPVFALKDFSAKFFSPTRLKKAKLNVFRRQLRLNRLDTWTLITHSKTGAITELDLSHYQTTKFLDRSKSKQIADDISKLIWN